MGRFTFLKVFLLSFVEYIKKFNVHKYRLYRRSTNKSVERQLLIVLNPFKDTRAYLHVVFSSVHFG